MAYLGRSLDKGNYLKLDDISSQFNGSTTTFNLTSGGTAFYPGSAFSILVSLAGVVQEPESAYQINQNQIIFAAAPLSSDDFFCIVLGVPLAVGVAANSTITGNQLSKPLNYNNGHLFFDSVNNRLGINSTTPRQALDVHGNSIITGVTTSIGGFVGNVTGNATGLSGTPNITVGNIIASSATINGNVSVAGTLTYEDVTNVDSLGIITARTGVRIDAGGLIVTAGVSTFTSDPVFIGAATSTGTASQRLQVTGGAYVSGNVGIGTTNPGEKLQVDGNVKATTFIGALTGNVTGNATGLSGTPNITVGTIGATSLDASGIVTATGGFNLGISSAGTSITSGPVKTLNFIGTGNTFAVNGSTVNISIAGGGGSVGGGGTWAVSSAGIHTTKSVGINTTTLDNVGLTGIGNSFQGLYISNGMIIVDNVLNGNHYIGTNFNGLMAGPVIVEGSLTIDGNYVVV